MKDYFLSQQGTNINHYEQSSIKNVILSCLHRHTLSKKDVSSLSCFEKGLDSCTANYDYPPILLDNLCEVKEILVKKCEHY